MAIDTGDLYAIKLAKYAAAADSTDFGVAFFAALKMVFEDLESVRVGVDPGTLPLVVATDMTIDPKYYKVIFIGLDYYIPQVSFWGQNDKRDLEGMYNKALGEAHTMYLADTTHYTRFGQIDD